MGARWARPRLVLHGCGLGAHRWYCTAAVSAHTASEPVYRSLRAELVALMGAEAYAVLVRHCEQAMVSSGGRRRLPLMVHPATAHHPQD